MESIDIVIPVFNESKGLKHFHAALRSALQKIPCHASTRCIYVNDGSTDDTQAALLALPAENPRVEILQLSRNFGHQAALTAGLDYADADFVVTMDGDGQHPPDVLPQMLALHAEGFDIVQPQRVDIPSSQGSLKTTTSRLFYWLLNHIGEFYMTPGTADFRSMTREVHQALNNLREYHRFLRGMVPWLGFKTVLLSYESPPRIAGNSQYSLQKMMRLAADGLFSFSLLPLRIGILLGCLFLVLGLGEIAYILSFWVFHRTDLLVPGWSSVIVMLTVGHGITMVLLGFIGVYVGMIFHEVKRRPVYVLRTTAHPAARSAHGSHN